VSISKVTGGATKVTWKYVISTDGAARGRNGQGPASSGFVIFQDGHVKFVRAVKIGIASNNVAEWTALLLALDWVLDEVPAGQRRIHFKSDSELMVRQIHGVYQAKHPSLAPLLESANKKFKDLDAYKVEHVYREFNTEADKACNAVLDSEHDVYEVDERV
jgi:ribonuclease HI